MYDNISTLFNNNKELKITFIDKLLSIKSIYTKNNFIDDSKNCLFFPFSISKNIKIDESYVLVKEILTKIINRPITIKSHILLTKRFVIFPDIHYNFIIFLTDPIESKDLKVTNIFWCNKDQIETFYGLHKYYIIGNEIEQMLQTKSIDNFSSTSDKYLQEYKLNPYISSIPFPFTKLLTLQSKIIVQSNCDQWVQNYVFADFMVNCYPCQVMCYPQFVGFAVARGYYMKRCKRLFDVLKDDKTRNMSFDEFLFGCICMDISSPHEGYLREARGNLIFKYYDYNKDKVLDFSEMECLVKRMLKKMGLRNNVQEITAFTENIMRLLDENSATMSPQLSKISLKMFQNGLGLSELEGLTHLLRFSISYLVNTRALMEKYIVSAEQKKQLLNDLNLLGEDFTLIPYFIREAYSSQELFKSMFYYSANYSAIKKLLQKLEEKNKMAIAKFKVKNVFSGFINQILYYLSEIAFDIYRSEITFPLRNPIFLVILFTAIAIVEPQLFHFSALFWSNILSFFIFNSPAFILAIRSYQQRNVISMDTSPVIAESSSSTHWTNKQNQQNKRREQMMLKNIVDKKGIDEKSGSKADFSTKEEKILVLDKKTTDKKVLEDRSSSKTVEKDFSTKEEKILVLDKKATAKKVLEDRSSSKIVEKDFSTKEEKILVLDKKTTAKKVLEDRSSSKIVEKENSRVINSVIDSKKNDSRQIKSENFRGGSHDIDQNSSLQKVINKGIDTKRNNPRETKNEIDRGGSHDIEQNSSRQRLINSEIDSKKNVSRQTKSEIVFGGSHDIEQNSSRQRTEVKSAESSKIVSKTKQMDFGENLKKEKLNDKVINSTIGVQKSKDIPKDETKKCIAVKKETIIPIINNFKQKIDTNIKIDDMDKAKSFSEDNSVNRSISSESRRMDMNEVHKDQYNCRRKFSKPKRD